MEGSPSDSAVDELLTIGYSNLQTKADLPLHAGFAAALAGGLKMKAKQQGAEMEQQRGQTVLKRIALGCKKILGSFTKRGVKSLRVKVTHR